MKRGAEKASIPFSPYVLFTICTVSPMRSAIRCGENPILINSDTWECKDNTINITKSLQHKASGDIVTPPKTDNGIRTITMPEAIMQEVRDYLPFTIQLFSNFIMLARVKVSVSAVDHLHSIAYAFRY